MLIKKVAADKMKKCNVSFPYLCFLPVHFRILVLRLLAPLDDVGVNLCQLGEPPVEDALVQLRVQEGKVGERAAEEPLLAVRYHLNTDERVKYYKFMWFM